MSAKGLNLESIAKGGMADKAPLPYQTVSDYTRGEYERALSPGANDEREADIDEYVDDVKELMKGHLKQQRNKLIEAGIIDPKTRLTGYGKIDDKHKHESGKLLKQVLVEDGMKMIAQYTLARAGYGEDFIKSLVGGLHAMKKDGDKVVPDHHKRRMYHSQLKSVMDSYFGRGGTYDTIVNELSNQKSITRAMKGDLGKLFEQTGFNIHPDAHVIKGYRQRLSSDLREAESFKAHVKTVADKKGLDVHATDLEELVKRHQMMLTDPDWKPEKDDPVMKPKPPKKK